VFSEGSSVVGGPGVSTNACSCPGYVL